MLTQKAHGRGVLARFLGGLWGVVNGLRKLVLNLLFLLILVIAVAAWWSSRAEAVQPRSVLVLDLRGPIVEQRSGSARQALIDNVQGGDTSQTRLRDVLLALDHASQDRNVASVLLTLDELSGGGLPVQREVAAAITRFRATGKKVVAWGMNYDQRAYFLAAHADEIYLHPMGAVLIEGYGRRRNYYRDALDRLGVAVNVVRAGRYKNALETFVANGPSPETQEADTALYQGLWDQYVEAVEKARRLPSGHLRALIEGLPDSLVAAGGDPARLALDQKLVDGLMTPDALRTMLIDRGSRDEKSKSFRRVDLHAYLRHVKPQRTGDAVGVVVAEGEIVDGDAPSGRIGGRTTAELLRKAREDELVKAIVLRVNSPGGSATASELVRRELQLTRAAGKPVVVSMGDVAASGGYWISLAADEVIADPATITGSIGVVAALPSAAGAMEKLSLHSAGTATTWLADAYDPRKPLDPRFAKLVQSVIDHLYGDFTAKAAAARKTTREKIDAVGQGRVWSGAQAKERGLVDRLGNLADALATARTRAKLPAESRVVYLEPSGGRLQQLLEMVDLQADGAASMGRGWQLQLLGLPLAGVAPAPLQSAAAELAWVADVAQRRKPLEALVHCLCEPAQ